MNRKRAVAAVAVAVVALGGCATQSSSPNVVRQSEANREQTVRMGVVESVRNVTIQRDNTGVGAVGGGLIGGIAGSTLGGGRGNAVGAVAGAVAGGVAGQAIEGSTNRIPGLEITVRLESGELRAIVQGAEENFVPGDRVRVVSSGGTTRVTR